MSNAVLLSPGDEFEKYTVVRELGHGGMGAVYLVHHRILDSDFALKVLFPEVADRDPQFVQRFIREARLAGRIHHQNLIAVHDAGLNEKNGMYYLVMDFVSGGSVRDKLKKNHYVDMLEALSIIRQVASALEAAQKHNMVHRDIKPDNIMFDAQGVVKLADLGIAKASDDRDTSLTIEASVFGTPAYMSPEQARDSSKVDTRADIYSLGVVLFEMLTGRRPFSGNSSIEILTQVIGDNTAPDVRTYSENLPEDVAQLVADMLMKDRDKRIASPTKLIKRLDALDLSAYQEAGECGGDSPELTMPTMVAPIQQPASAPDVTMPTMAAPTQQPVPQQPDVTMPTMAAPTQQSAPQQPDVTMPTMGAPTQQSAPRQPDVTMPTMAAPTVQQRPVSEPSNPTVTLAAAPQTDEPRKQESGAARKTAFAKKPLIVTVAASVVVVLCVVGGLFLMKGGSSNPPSSPENVAETTRPPEVVPPPKENPSTAKTEVTKTNPPPQKPAERPKPEVTEAVPSKPEEKTEPEVVVPQPKEVKPPKKELKTLGTVDAGSVVLFGADNSRTGSLFQALAGEGSLKAVGYQEASKELKEWSAQLGEIQGRSPAFVIVAITDEKNSLAFRRMIPEMMKVLSSQNAAILVGSGDTGIYDEVKEACNANGMFFRTWASNRELVSYVLGLRSELGW